MAQLGWRTRQNHTVASDPRYVIVYIRYPRPKYAPQWVLLMDTRPGGKGFSLADRRKLARHAMDLWTIGEARTGICIQEQRNAVGLFRSLNDAQGYAEWFHAQFASPAPDQKSFEDAFALTK